MTFQVGEKVVYPNHGVATIENISSRAFAGQQERFYLLRLSAGSLTVTVPFSHADHVGLRKVTRNGQLARVIEYLGEGRRKRLQVRAFELQARRSGVAINPRRRAADGDHDLASAAVSKP